MICRFCHLEPNPRDTVTALELLEISKLLLWLAPVVSQDMRHYYKEVAFHFQLVSRKMLEDEAKGLP